jgi:hypothetical protein
MDTTEQQVDSVVVPILKPLVLSWLSHLATVLATGTTIRLSFGDDDATTIIVDAVSAAFVVWHLLQMKAQKLKTAQTSFVQGAASVGVVVPAPQVVSGKAPDPVPPSSTSLAGVPASPKIIPVVGESGMLGVEPSSLNPPSKIP